MFPDSLYYAMKDYGPTKKMIQVPQYSLRRFNEDGYGVFYTVNAFDGERLKSRLTHLNAWYVETDDLAKTEVMERVSSAPIAPSIINESRAGFHILYLTSDQDADQYKRVLKGLIEYYGGDQLSDTTRLLRVPGFNNWKNGPEAPFEVQTILSCWERTYTTDEMLKAFPYAEPTVTIRKRAKMPLPCIRGAIPCLIRYPVEEGLERLSGKEAVMGDVYELEENGNGTIQIWVNGSRSSSWIDGAGKIGSHKRWGPSLYQWLLWYDNQRNPVSTDEERKSRVRQIYDKELLDANG